MINMQQRVSLAECSVIRHLPAPPALLRRHDTGPSSVARPQHSDARHWEQLFLEQLPTIARLISSVTRRHGLSSVDAEDFAAEVHLRLISDDYAVLRKFGSRCQLRTFLRV